MVTQGEALPGAMVTTRTPMGARSLAMGRVIPTMPPLEAEYAAWPTFNHREKTAIHYSLRLHSWGSIGFFKELGTTV